MHRLTFLVWIGGIFLGAETVRIGSALQAPHAYKDAVGRAQGFFVDVMSEAALRTGREMAWVFQSESMDRVVPSGDIDLYAGAFSTPERKKLFYVSDPWWSEELYVVVRTDRGIRSLRDLRGKSLVYSKRPLPIPAEMAFSGSKPIEFGNRARRLTAICLGNYGAGLFDHFTL